MLDNKNAVMATEFRYGSVGAGLAHGMRRLGWGVKEVDIRTFTPQGESLLGKVAGRMLRRLNMEAYNAAICNEVERVDATVFVTVKGLEIYQSTLKFMKRRGVVAINYYPDVHFRHNGLDISTFPFYDMVFTTKSFQIEHLGRLLGTDRAVFLHHGYCDDTHYPRYGELSDDDYLSDVTYVGNHAEYKERWLNTLTERLPDIRLRIIGWRWDQAKDRKLKSFSVPYALDGDFYCRILQRSRINLGLHGGPFKPDNWEDLVSTRTFEIPACKGFMLHIDNAEVRTLFEAENEIGLFSSPDELADKITYYLSRPKLRADMIARAYDRSVPAYGYDARAKSICDRIEKLLCS